MPSYSIYYLQQHQTNFQILVNFNALAVSTVPCSNHSITIPTSHLMLYVMTTIQIQKWYGSTQ